MRSSLHDMFSNLLKEAEPHATCVVRVHSGLGLCDSDDIVLLGAHNTVHHLYARWCFECGHIVKADGKGNVGAVRDYTPRNDDSGSFGEFVQCSHL